MPSLTKQAVLVMLADESECTVCGCVVHRQYCRQCDEYCTEGHHVDCDLAEHIGHRGYDEHAPSNGNFMGWIYERDHGSYRIGGTRGPATNA